MTFGLFSLANAAEENTNANGISRRDKIMEKRRKEKDAQRQSPFAEVKKLN
jgi:hypothetical protein